LAGAICVTPAPMLAGSAAWRWPTPAGGAVVRRESLTAAERPDLAESAGESAMAKHDRGLLASENHDRDAVRPHARVANHRALGAT
jgi:hypothetical protein